MMTMSRTTVNSLILAGLACVLAACGANEGILKSGKETPAPPSADAPARSSVDRDLEEMRVAGFAYIYILRRKDGGKIDAEDKGVLKLHTVNANRRVLSDADRAILIGTNFPIPPESMTALYNRFAVEDHSPPPPANANINANK